ncbi:MAG: Pr6Pr family membrane protein [Rhodobacteraceae bacterium]|nr:Pr6Pr family membrane protein [Paracoccaceae bacterium]
MTQTTARTAAAAVALLAAAALVAQFIDSGTNPDLADPLIRLWRLGRYFTILTNTLVAFSFAAIALGRHPGDSWVAGVLLSIGMVGLVYHTLLAPEVPFEGLEFWADLGLHTLVPLAVLGWWLVWGGKALRPGQVPWWLLWPAGYCAYALVRGLIDGRYPYFFLDIGRFGLARVALNVAGMVLAFYLAGLVLLVLARLLSGRAPAAPS